MRELLAAPRAFAADAVHDDTGRLLGRLTIGHDVARWSPDGVSRRREVSVGRLVEHIERRGAHVPSIPPPPNIRWGLGQPAVFWIFGERSDEEGFLVALDGFVEWRRNASRCRRRLSIVALIEFIDRGPDAPRGVTP